MNEEEKLSYTAARVQLFNQAELLHSKTFFFTKGEEAYKICIHMSNVVLSPHAYETPLSTELLPLPFPLFQDFYSKSPGHLKQ